MTASRRTQKNCLRTSARWDVHARIDPTGYVRLLWKSSEEEKGSHAAIFEVKFGEKAEGSFTDSRERTAETLFSDLESVVLFVEGSDLKETPKKGNWSPDQVFRECVVVYNISIMNER